MHRDENGQLWVTDDELDALAKGPKWWVIALCVIGGASVPQLLHWLSA